MPERERAFDVVLERVADHRGVGRLDLEQVEHRREDRRVRLRLAVMERADPGVDLERVMPREVAHVARGVRDEPDLQPRRAQLVEHGHDVLVELEVLVALPAARELDGARRATRARAAHADDDRAR